ncbi:hypothetical protein JNUCC23_01995 [Peribacillus sp. JNUCC 23]
MAENFEAIIGANIRDFQRAMREVDRQIRDTASGADAEIGADISEFMSEMGAVDAILSDLAREHDIDIGADVSEAMSEISEVEAALNTLPSELEIDVETDVADALSDIAQVEATLTALPNDVNIDIETDVAGAIADVAAVGASLASLPNNTTVDINADISDVVADVAVVRTSLWQLAMTRVLIPIETRVNNFQQTISRIANFTRSYQELQQTTARGIMISLSPAIVPLLATLGGLIGNLGPMIGVLAGSTFALASSFGVAGAGAIGFGAVAVSNLKDVFSASSELKKLQEKLDDASSLKERNKILKEMKEIQGSLNAEQTKALESMNGLKKVWSGITKDLQTETLQIFTKALNIFGEVLTTLKPMFGGVTNAVNRLMDSLGRQIKSESMMAFFNYLNKMGGPLLERITKSVGNLIQGLFNMMVAFEPLTDATSKGFLEMTQRFEAWSKGLSESEGFRSFVNYVNENMPKVRAIFRDAIVGIINLFAAFAPSSAGMMTSLQDMMARFKEWSATLGENQQFQAFINYIKTNGPQVVALIGNITTFLTNLGIALAPTGAWLLGIVNGIISWTSSMISAHPWIGKILGAVIVLTGMLIAAVPNIIAFATLFELRMVQAFGTFIASAARATAAWVANTATMIRYGVLIAAQSTANAIRTAAAWTIATGASMARSVASTVTSVASMIAQWVRLAAISTANAIRAAAAWTLATGAAMARSVASMVTTAALFVARWTVIGAQAMIHAAKVAAAWALSTGAAMARAVASMIATAAVFVARWVWMGVQAMAQAARMAAAWFIALGPIGWVTGAIVALAILIIANWDKIKAATVKIWTAISDAVKKAWEAIKKKAVEGGVALVKIISELPGKVKAFAGEMLSAGADLIAGLIKGIISKASGAVTAIKETVGNMVDAAKSMLKIHSPSRVFKDIGVFVGEGMVMGVSSMSSAVGKAGTGLAKAAIPDLSNLIKSNEQTLGGYNKSLIDLNKNTQNEISAITKKAKTDRIEIENKAQKEINAITKKAYEEKRKLTVTEHRQVKEILEKTSKESVNIQKKEAADILNITNGLAKERLDSTKNFISNKRSLEQISVKDEIKIWESTIKLYKDGTDEKIEAQLALRDAKRAMDREMLDLELDYIKEKKRIGEIGLADEVRMLETLSKKYAVESTKYTQIQQQKADVLKQINEKMASINEEYLSRTRKINDDMIAEEKRLTDAYNNSVNERAKSLYSFSGLFDQMKTSFEGTGSDLIGNLKGQVAGFKEWSADIAELASKGIDGGLLEELRLMGPKAYGEIAALNNLTSTELDEYQSLWKEKSSLAREQAISELEGLKTDTQTQIENLHHQTANQLESLRLEWIKKIEAITAGTAEELSTLESIGKDAMQGLYDGMASMEGDLVGKAKQIANSIKNAITSALDIHSPSRVLRTIGQYAGQGLVVGLNDSISAVSAVSKQMALASIPNLTGMTPKPLDTQSQMDDLKGQIKQELSVDMSVNHKGSGGLGGGFNPTITNYFTPAESTPAESARKQKQMLQRAAFGWRG